MFYLLDMIIQSHSGYNSASHYVIHWGISHPHPFWMYVIHVVYIVPCWFIVMSLYPHHSPYPPEYPYLMIIQHIANINIHLDCFAVIYLRYNLHILLVGGLEHVLFFRKLGMIIPIDGLIFFRGVGLPPTRYSYIP